MKLVESTEMLAYWQTAEAGLDIGDWCHLIAQSRASLSEKAKVLREISERYPVEKFDERHNPIEMANVAEYILAETENVPQGSVFIMTEYWLDKDIEWCAWRNISRWDLGRKGELIERMTWYLSESSVILGGTMEPDSDKLWNLPFVNYDTLKRFRLTQKNDKFGLIRGI